MFVYGRSSKDGFQDQIVNMNVVNIELGGAGVERSSSQTESRIEAWR